MNIGSSVGSFLFCVCPWAHWQTRRRPQSRHQTTLSQTAVAAARSSTASHQSTSSSLRPSSQVAFRADCRRMASRTPRHRVQGVHVRRPQSRPIPMQNYVLPDSPNGPLTKSSEGYMRPCKSKTLLTSRMMLPQLIGATVEVALAMILVRMALTQIPHQTQTVQITQLATKTIVRVIGARAQ